MTFVDSGWIERDNDRVPVAVDGATRLEVGQAHVLPLALDSSQWFATTTRVVLGHDGRTTSRDIGQIAAQAALSGHSLDRVEQLLTRARPDPLAEKHADLPADKRIEVVRSELDGEPTESD